MKPMTGMPKIIGFMRRSRQSTSQRTNRPQSGPSSDDSPYPKAAGTALQSDQFHVDAQLTTGQHTGHGLEFGHGAERGMQSLMSLNAQRLDLVFGGVLQRFRRGDMVGMISIIFTSGMNSSSKPSSVTNARPTVVTVLGTSMLWRPAICVSAVRKAAMSSSARSRCRIP